MSDGPAGLAAHGERIAELTADLDHAEERLGRLRYEQRRIEAELANLLASRRSMRQRLDRELTALSGAAGLSP